MNKIEELGFTKTDIQTLNNGDIVLDRVDYKANTPTNKDFYIDLIEDRIVIYETDIFKLKAIVDCVVEEYYTPEPIIEDYYTEEEYVDLDEEIDLEELAEEIGEIVL